MTKSGKTTLLQIARSETTDDPVADHVRRITELAIRMDEPQIFRKGQMVRWKAGLKNRLIPAHHEPAIVREVLAVPVIDTCDAARCASSPLFGEPLTVVLGVVDPDGDFIEVRYDARRFEPL